MMANTVPAAWLEIVLGIASILVGVVWAALHEVGFTRWISGGRISPRYIWMLAWGFVLFGTGFALYGIVRALTPLP
jgi:hypothetical protein